MWKARPCGSLDGNDEPEILFLDPNDKPYPSELLRKEGFDPLEVYIRRLGTPEARREAGWKVGVPPESFRPGRVWDGENFRFLQTVDPRGRHCMIEFQKPAPVALLQQLRNQLFEEMS